ncbi:polysaccharide deacetylase family protein [Deinococcus sedimenti]|uniref:Polysaccharide deacetylase n=1 Tax=Deinococcus sedimenti TaxID=1867090 RepID=A0ABQ2S401_9DEIO|nr:polysaccharide deacetylase family protein [Deinococcus sedimenti]GGR89895.1 polysaccharide deacetylase [Deinococcus sedimenti]
MARRRRALGGAAFLLVPAVLAELLGRAAGWGALGHGPRDGWKVAVTFDDGPGDRTRELLEILAQYGARGTFFVTRPAAQAHPELLDAIEAAGHTLDAHGVWHRHALTLTPWMEWAQVAWHPRPQRVGLHLYRPPYGGHSPLTRLFARLAGRQVALWDTESRDWTDAEPASLAAQTLARVQPGSVILLHDGPAGTPALLDALLRGLQERGLAVVPMHELPPQRIILLGGLKRLRDSYGA